MAGTAFCEHEGGSRPPFGLDMALHLVTFHRFRTDIVTTTVPVLEVTDLDTATALGKDGKASNGQRDRNLLVARQCPADDEVAALTLDVHDGTTITFTPGATTPERQARCRRFATHLQVQTAQPDLAGTTDTIRIVVRSAVNTPKCATKNNVLFIDSVVTDHLLLDLVWFVL